MSEWTELVDILKKFPEKQAYNIIRTGILSGAELVAAAAKRLAPVDTGALAKSIKARRASGRGKDVLRAVVEAGGGKGEAWYANIVEKGHLVKQEDGKTVGQVPAKPYMVPAIEETKDQILSTIESTIRDEIMHKAFKGFNARRRRSRK